MASNSGSSHSLADEFGSLSAAEIWKGENESDAELMEGGESPLANAGAWTEEEAYRVYREKLIRLRDLYVGQLDHMHRTLQKKRRQFLLQWQYESRRQKPGAQVPERRNSESALYRHYHKKSGEEALLDHKLKQKRLTTSLEYFLKKETRNNHKAHYQYLIKQHHRLCQPLTHCNNHGCDNKCLPLSNKCSRHICDDNRQLLYTRCAYVYPSGLQCTNPIPKYLEPLLCGGHCDNIKPPEQDCDVSASTKGPAESEEHTDETKPSGNGDDLLCQEDCCNIDVSKLPESESKEPMQSAKGYSDNVNLSGFEHRETR